MGGPASPDAQATAHLQVGGLHVLAVHGLRMRQAAAMQIVQVAGGVTGRSPSRLLELRTHKGPPNEHPAPHPNATPLTPPSPSPQARTMFTVM